VLANESTRRFTMAKITVIPLFKNLSLSAGESGTSDPIDLRYIASKWTFSLSHSIAAGTSTTCGTSNFSYKVSQTLNGVYVNPPSPGTFGTTGPAILPSVITFTPALTPFMRIIAAQAGAGTAGANSKINAELNVQ
jgi:hypothetical protein